MSNGAALASPSPRRPTARTSNPTFHLLAGLASGISSAILLQPADLLKTRVQQSRSATLLSVLRDIARGPQPLRQLWRGTLPSALRTGVGSALYFASLNSLRQGVVARRALLDVSSSTPLDTALPSSNSSALPRLSHTANLATGALARASVGFLLMPITVIKVRFESSYFAYRSLAHAASSILRTEGPRGFFAGFGATAARDAPYAGLYVLFYEGGKKYLSALGSTQAERGGDGGRERERGMSGTASVGINFVSGMLAAALATALTNPFDAIKTRLQLMPARYGNMVKAARIMLREEGARSLFDGLGLRMGRKALSSALAWTVYEEFVRRAERRMF